MHVIYDNIHQRVLFCGGASGIIVRTHGLSCRWMPSQRQPLGASQQATVLPLLSWPLLEPLLLLLLLRLLLLLLFVLLPLSSPFLLYGSFHHKSVGGRGARHGDLCTALVPQLLSLLCILKKLGTRYSAICQHPA